MRRPLCVFCAGMLGVELVCVFLPQTELFVPFAAFFVAVCLVLCIFDAARKAALCILLGAAVGMASVLHTANRLERIRVQYAGRPLMLTAEVESTADSYDPGIVDAVLHVEKVNGSAASFRVECSALPECKAGERVQGRFILSAPASGSRGSLYADGIALQAEMDEDGSELTVLGESSSFRARTHRLQQRLSASLRRRMDGKTGGVLAAMTTGDRSYLSSAMRSAYRGAGLAHVLVVSGMHVSILCGDILSTLLPYEWEQSYRRRRCRAVFRSLLAFLLMGVTGFTPSVCRAAVAVWVGALGVWLYGPPDTLTSLAVAGIVMTAGNSYAVCDIGFELSFAAVVGTVAGGVCIRRARDAWYRQFWKNAKNPVKRPWYFKLPERLWGLAESICISFCASVATFPVLVLRGLSVSIYAVVSSVAVLWLIQPMMLLGLCRPGTRSCSAVWGAVRSVCGVDRPARPLGRLDLCKTGRGHLLRYGLCSHRVSGADPVVLAGVPLAGTAAGGRAMHPAGGSCFHRAGQCSQPGCSAHRPCRQRQRAGSGRHPERYRRGVVPGRSFCPERSGKPACPAGRADCGACGRPAHKP